MARDVIEIRKEKLMKIVSKPTFWVLTLLLTAVILGVYIRSMPMHDHGGRPGLWDITRNDWTLGPDLDPWLFTRQAKTIAQEGTLPTFDMMRNVPLGFENAKETVLLPYMIYWTWELVNQFGDYSVEFAAALFPVIMFGLTIIAFFLFVREAFLEKDSKEQTRANLIAIIATFIMTVVPVFLSRTIAGIPEKESAVFFFLFMTFYLYLRAWRINELNKKIVFGFLSGVSIALGALISGLYIYGFITIALSTFVAFLIGSIKQKNQVTYIVWFLPAVFTILAFSERFTLLELLTSTTTGIGFLTLFVFLVDSIIWRTKISKNPLIKKLKFPKNIISVIIAMILGILFISIVFGPDFIIAKLKSLHQQLFKAITGRWNITVAENRQPHFTEWVGSFGPYVGKIAVMFWMFVAGSALLVWNALQNIRKKDALKITGYYLLFLFGLIFSRYSESSVLNGENFLSKSFYYITAGLLVWILLKIYIQYRREGHVGFEKIPYTSLLLIALFLLTVFSARSAIRLVMVLGPVGAIFVGYLIIEITYRFLESKKESNARKLFGILAIILIVLGAYMFISFNRSVQSQSYNTIPSAYNFQWQRAMDWVRTETPTDAIFAHWWDYGYWVQSIGERATVTDGGNAITFWNYLSGRYVLTGDNQKDALDFLHAHNADYLLIDSSDIGKYGAFSSIGSNYSGDRQSFIPLMGSNPNQITETATGITRVYQAQFGIDEDITYNKNSTKLFLATGAAAVIGAEISFTTQENQTIAQQPIIHFADNRGGRYQIPMRYAEIGGEFIDFGSGLPGALKIVQSYFNQNGGQIGIDPLGGALYVSPRVMRGFLAQKYLFDDPFNTFGQFEVAHIESSLIVESLRSSGAPAGEFVLYGGSLQGPIMIWEIEYTGDEEFKEMYVDKDSSKYISWEL